MTGHSLDVTVHSAGRSEPRSLAIRSLVIAGWTGRDPVARDKHIAELEALGVKPPASTPIFYRAAASRLCAAGTIEVSGTASSGEVEFVLIREGDRILVGVGSDHTDREVEIYNITVSKQMCEKPMAPDLWDLADVEPHWDQLVLRSWATIAGERHLYQEGTLAGMLGPRDLIDRGFGSAGMPDGCALFGGTFAAMGGIRAASRFAYEIEDPVLERSIWSSYDVVCLPVLG